MNDLTTTGTNTAAKKKYISLSHSLIVWFLLLSLLPLSLVSWLSYQQAKNNLIRNAEEKLEQSSESNVRFIHNWFDYRFMDLKSQAELQNNIRILSKLKEGLQTVNKNLAEYVESDDWLRRINGKQKDLVNLKRRYDYIYDLFLIDTEGNILYSVAHESDMGTNLFNGPYAHTLFANAVRLTQQSGKVSFSGLERYEPSNNDFAGFISAPLLDEAGQKLGVFAMQLRFDRIFNLLNAAISNNSSLNHYLVSKDGLLHTPVKDKSWNEVVDRVIDTEQIRIIRNDVIEHKEHKEKASEYIGPNGEVVIGIHQKVNLANVKWFLISEVKSSEALASAQWLGRVTLVLVLFTALIVTSIAFYLARRITQPIITLAHASMKVSAGDTNQQVNISVNNEIGILASAFNHMLQTQQIHDQELEQSSQQTQQVLAELNQQKFALDQHASVGITDLQGTIAFANEKFSEMSGYSREELIGQNHRILKSGYHDDEFYQNMYDTITKGEVWHGEICNKAKDGHVYWVDTTIVPCLGNAGKLESYVVIRTDITERKEVEEALIEAKTSAEDAAHSKSEFLASMSHEIRTPMNGVLGMLGLLLNTQLDENQHHHAKVAQESAKSLLTVINDILDFSKVEAGKLDLESLDFNLFDMLGTFTETMSFQAQEKNLELVLDITNVQECIVKGDPGRLRQILTNIVGNAIKFTSQGEVVIHVGLQAVNDQQWQLNCNITDTGIGIPEDKLPHLFDSFSQVDASTTRDFGGTGLGLAIAKKLCELMGGSISVSSELGKGSCFKLNVLLDKSTQSHLVMPQVDIQELNLLLVAGNIANRKILRDQLEHWGVTVMEARSRSEALAICKEQAQQKNKAFFDVAFLDMQMPGVSCTELGKILKADERFNSMKLVVTTSAGCQGDARFFAELGFSGYFPTPITTSNLRDLLSVLADDGEALRQAEPLVTRHYLNTLEHNEEDVFEENIQTWPNNTRLLLVEDNKVNQMVATGILEENGLQVDVVDNGLKALDNLRQASQNTPYSLVLMDCQMPEMDGYEASQEIRAGKAGMHNKAIPIVAMTANAMLGDREKCMQVGMNDYLSKPIEPEQLIAKLNKWLAKVKDKPTKEKASEQTLDHTTKPDLVIWDKEALKKRTMGKEKLLKALIDVFFEETPPRMIALQQAIDGGDIEQVRHLAHTLKGVGANISGLQLRQQAHLMEAAAKEANLEKVSELMPDLQQAFEQLMQCFEQYK